VRLPQQTGRGEHASYRPHTKSRHRVLWLRRCWQQIATIVPLVLDSKAREGEEGDVWHLEERAGRVQMRSLQHQDCVEKFPDGRVGRHPDILTYFWPVACGLTAGIFLLAFIGTCIVGSSGIYDVRLACSLNMNKKPSWRRLLHAAYPSGGFDSR